MSEAQHSIPPSVTTKSSFSERYPNLNFDVHDGRVAVFEKFVKENPKVDKKKLMLYWASGTDLSPLVGSGVSEAYYVDPIYDYKNTTVIHWWMQDIKVIDPQASFSKTFTDHPEVPYAEHNQTTGFVEFNLDGERKKLILDAHYAPHVPDEVLKRGCSVFTVLGLLGNKLFIPPVKADVYAVSLAYPRAWGFRDIAVVGGMDSDVAIAYDFENQDLSKSEINVLNSRANNTGFEIIAKELQTGNIREYLLKRAFHTLGFPKKQMSRFKKMTLEELATATLERDFKSLAILRPNIVNILLDDMTEYVEEEFHKLGDVEDASLIGRTIVDVLSRLRK